MRFIGGSSPSSGTRKLPIFVVQTTNMKYTIDQKQLKAILSGKDSYAEIVRELSEQVLGLRRPFTTVPLPGGGTLSMGAMPNDAGTQFLLDAKVLVAEDELATQS